MFFSGAILALAAVGANAIPAPAPGGVTAYIAPSASAPAGCLPTYSGSFGIAVRPLGTGNSNPVVATQAADGQPAKGSSTAASVVSQRSDGQPNVGTSAALVTQISDGQIQAGTKTMMAVTQIGDGQVQAPKITAVSQITDGQVQAPKVTAVSQITDGQVQAPKSTAAPVSQISDGQVQAPKSTAAPVSQISDGQPQAPKVTAVSQISDGQPQAKSTLTTSTTKAVSQLSDGQPQASGSGSSSSSSSSNPMLVACQVAGTASITLANGKLLDSRGRTGYIASNFQFQFDDPPQAGAIFTGGFSHCGNGSLALGGSSVFYSCNSGSFSNLYSENVAAQCVPVEIDFVQLTTC